MTPILPMLRTNAHNHPVVGSHTATQDGIYEIIFDNSYSRYGYGGSLCSYCVTFYMSA